LPLKRLRYTVLVNGRPKKILSVALQSRGDLIIDFKAAEEGRSEPRTSKTDSMIELHRLSVHTSRNSPEGNQIKSTIVASDGPIYFYHFTRAIKNTMRFAPVLHRRFPDISYNWDESTEKSDILLGGAGYQSNTHTLMTSLFIGPAQRLFFDLNFSSEATNYYLRQDIIGNYRIVILYTFLPIPSIQHGISHFENTFVPGSNGDPYREFINNFVMNGYDEKQIRDIFHRKIGEMSQNHFDIIADMNRF